MIPATPHSSLTPLDRLLIASTLLALLAVLAHFVLPEKKERILRDRAKDYHLSFNGQNGGKTVAKWVDESQLTFTCIANADGSESP